MSLLEITGLSACHRGTPILQDVSLSINAGQIVAVTGESGSGKSMTALGVMGLLPDRTTRRARSCWTVNDLLSLSEADMCACAATTSVWCFRNP